MTDYAKLAEDTLRQLQHTGNIPLNSEALARALQECDRERAEALARVYEQHDEIRALFEKAATRAEERDAAYLDASSAEERAGRIFESERECWDRERSAALNGAIAERFRTRQAKALVQRYREALEREWRNAKSEYEAKALPYDEGRMDLAGELLDALAAGEKP